MRIYIKFLPWILFNNIKAYFVANIYKKSNKVRSRASKYSITGKMYIIDNFSKYEIINYKDPARFFICLIFGVIIEFWFHFFTTLPIIILIFRLSNFVITLYKELLKLMQLAINLQEKKKIKMWRRNSKILSYKTIYKAFSLKEKVNFLHFSIGFLFEKCRQWQLVYWKDIN